jgi:type IV pilus assembly protein PilC
LLKTVEGGHSLSQGFAQSPEVFPPLTVHMVLAGERSGLLAEVLEQHANYLERGVNLSKKMRAAFTYPALLMVMMLVILAVMSVFVFPQEKEMLESLGGELPWLSVMVLGFFETVFNPYLVGAITVAVLVVTFTWPWFGKPFYKAYLRRIVDEALLQIPLVGSIVFKAASARLLFAMATLLGAGATLGPPMKIVAEVADNEIVSERFSAAMDSMTQGLSLFEAFSVKEVFPNLALQLFCVADELGEVEVFCRRLSKIFEEEVEGQLETLASLMEPIALFIMGSVIGLVLLASALPTMNLMQQL